MKVIAVLVLALFPSSASAFIVESGKAIREVAAEMKAAKYPEVGLQITAGVGRMAMCWEVDDGVLVVNYWTQNGIVEKVSFWILDRPAKSKQPDFFFSFPAKRFDTMTGEMLIQTKRK